MEQKKEGVYYTKKAIRDMLPNMIGSQSEPDSKDKILESGSAVGSFLTRAEDLIRNASQSV